MPRNAYCLALIAAYLDEDHFSPRFSCRSLANQCSLRPGTTSTPTQRGAVLALASGRVRRVVVVVLRRHGFAAPIAALRFCLGGNKFTHPRTPPPARTPRRHDTFEKVTTDLVRRFDLAFFMVQLGSPSPPTGAESFDPLSTASAVNRVECFSDWSRAFVSSTFSASTLE
jgi:hypothetical protein